MTTIYLTRHGETEENSKRILQGHLPTRLNSTGIKQAHDLKDSLQNIHFDAILSSDLIRSIETAKIIAEPHQQDVICCPLIQERNWGSWSGASIPDIQGKEFPQDVETVDDMFKRAEKFLELVQKEYANQTLLVVGHGLMDRVILACLQGKTIKDIPPFANTEVRILELSQEGTYSCKSLEDTLADN